MKKSFLIFIIYFLINSNLIMAHKATLEKINLNEANNIINMIEEIKWKFVYNKFIHNSNLDYLKRITWRFINGTISTIPSIALLTWIGKNKSILNKINPEDAILAIAVIIFAYMITSYIIENIKDKYVAKNQINELIIHETSKFPKEIQEDIIKLKDTCNNQTPVSKHQKRILKSINQAIYNHFKKKLNKRKFLRNISAYLSQLAALIILCKIYSDEKNNLVKS